MPEEKEPQQREKKKSRRESLGEYLKRERLLRNITLQDISRVTKISQRFLVALEEENYRMLPAETFVKGFLRAYAKTIGLDPYEVILVYEENYKTKEDSVDLRALLDEEEEEEEFPKKSRKKPLLISIAGVIIVMVALYFGWEFYRDRIQGADVAKTAKPPVQKEAVQPAITKEPVKGMVKKQPTLVRLPKLEPYGMGAQARPDAQWLNSGEGKIWLRDEKTVLFAEGLSLAVKAKSDIWARVKLDPPEGASEEAFIDAGLGRIWFAKEKIVLSFNKLDGVELELNGQQIPLTDNEESRQAITITRDNLQ